MRTLGQGGAMRWRGHPRAGRIEAAPKRRRGRTAAPRRDQAAIGQSDLAPRPEGGRGHVATGASSGSTPARRALHIAIGALGWLIFAGLWVWQLEVFVPSNWLAGLEALGAILVVFALATPAWVAWNRRIYRRRHRRTMPVVRDVDFDRDGLGRTIEAELGVRTAAGEIVIEVGEDDRVKRYRAAAIEG